MVSKPSSTRRTTLNHHLAATKIQSAFRRFKEVSKPSSTRRTTLNHHLAATKIQSAFRRFKEVSSIRQSRSVDFVVSTEKLRQRLLEEGLSETAIQDSEQIMRSEFTAMQNQLLSLKQEHRRLIDTLRQLETEKVDLENTVVDESQKYSKEQGVTSRSKQDRSSDWSKRMHIALGAGRGLLYLHEQCNPKIIHRDVKAANILLDESFKAVVCDFGLAKLLDRKDSHVTTAVRGTIGHIAPEYLSTGQSSEKTDVFGYGILLLELITGQKTIDAGEGHVQKGMMLDWVKKLHEEKKLDMLADRDLNGCYSAADLEKTVELALRCTLPNPSMRPKMSEALKVLERITGETGHGEGLQACNSLMEERTCISMNRHYTDLQEQHSFVFEDIELLQRIAGETGHGEGLQACNSPTEERTCISVNRHYTDLHELHSFVFEDIELLQRITGETGHGEGLQACNSPTEERTCISVNRHYTDLHELHSFVFEDIELSGPR